MCCFGSRPDGSRAEPIQEPTPHPRPVSVPARDNPSTSTAGLMSNNPYNPSNQTQYNPPPGPPPSHGPGDYAPPPGPPPGHFAPPPGPPPGAGEFAPPPGPPPGHFAPPPGPPPGYKQPKQQFAPPPGPPPSHEQNYAPPPGPPPSQAKPPEAWETAVPDTALLPPPPAFFSGWERSPTNNASTDDAERGAEWCHLHKLLELPINLDHTAVSALSRYDIGLVTPDSWKQQYGPGKAMQPYQGSERTIGVWGIHTTPQCQDTTLISYPPLYSTRLHRSALDYNSNESKTIYYEIQNFSSHRNPAINVALGFAALPYPTFRLPGWHRGSVAVHGDDGHKYLMNPDGGQSFVAPFHQGAHTVGLGLTFSKNPHGPGIDVHGFFTRNGNMEKRWNLHEETDAEQDGSAVGLEGAHDVAAAIGMFEKADFEVVFHPQRWAYGEARRLVGYPYKG